MVQRFYRNELKCVGSIPHESKGIPITDNWIRPAPRASGLRRKRQCGVSLHMRSVKKICRVWRTVDMHEDLKIYRYGEVLLCWV
jgi:hypothetical protein